MLLMAEPGETPGLRVALSVQGLWLQPPECWGPHQGPLLSSSGQERLAPDIKALGCLVSAWAGAGCTPLGLELDGRRAQLDLGLLLRGP